MKLLYYRDLRGHRADRRSRSRRWRPRRPSRAAPTTAASRWSGPALPSDHFKSPFPNDKAARAANGGALPPDQSLIIKAREDGPNYVHALLNGYIDPPAGVKVPDGQYYNEYFPGHFLAMPPPLHDGQVTYSDGTKATVEQMSQGHRPVPDLGVGTVHGAAQADGREGGAVPGADDRA